MPFLRFGHSSSGVAKVFPSQAGLRGVDDMSQKLQVLKSARSGTFNCSTLISMYEWPRVQTRPFRPCKALVESQGKYYNVVDVYEAGVPLEDSYHIVYDSLKGCWCLAQPKMHHFELVYAVWV